ncbi:hypothetical protein [Ketobacter sp.]|uniref:hypothetical protein n=1 Tax=Ketobacter sp. TaxID=2083498 RepID=UPI000F1FEF4E|nr:hypothetical protein [Ketobacter sp.]RLT93077.1 MAG: hypothetical protein D9N14_19680 [Ketobacter sp.]
MLQKLIRQRSLLLLLLLLGWLQASQMQVLAHEATHWFHDSTELCDDLQLAHHNPGALAPVFDAAAAPLPPQIIADLAPTQWTGTAYLPPLARGPPRF